MLRAFRSTQRLRAAVLMTAAAVPFTMNRPMAEQPLPEPQQAEQGAESEEDAVPAFMVTIDPYFLDQLLHRGRQQRKTVAVGGLDFGPSPAFSSPSTARAPPPPSNAASSSAPSASSHSPSSASSSSSSPSSVTSAASSKSFAPPQRQSSAAAAADNVITPSPAAAPTLPVLSTDDISTPPHTTRPSQPKPQPQTPSSPPPPQQQRDEGEEAEGSFFAPFWSSVKDTAAAVSHSVASLSSSVSSAISSSSSSSSPHAGSSAYEHGREEGRLEAYRELDGYVQRTEAEKLALEEEFRRRDREREEQRLLALAAPMRQVEAARRETGLRRGRVCEEETRAVLDCYRSSMADVLRCDVLVREYAMCADRAKEAAFRGSH